MFSDKYVKILKEDWEVIKKDYNSMLKENEKLKKENAELQKYKAQDDLLYSYENTLVDKDIQINSLKEEIHNLKYNLLILEDKLDRSAIMEKLYLETLHKERLKRSCFKECDEYETVNTESILDKTV